MRPIEIFRQVADQHGAMVARPRKNAPGEYDAKPYFTGSHRGWVAVDAFTASAVVRVYNALSPANREKFDKLSLTRAVDITWSVLK